MLDRGLAPLHTAGALRVSPRPLLVAAVALVSRRAAAREAPVDLHWVAPAGCPGAERVAADVAALVGEGPVRRLEASGEVTRSRDGGWTVQLATGAGGARRTRELTAPSCEELAHAVATLLAIQVSPGEAASGPPGRPPEAPALPPVTATRASPASDAREASDVRLAPRPAPPLAASLLAGGGVGATGTAPMVAVALGFVPRQSRWEVFGAWSPPHRVEAPDGSAGDVALWAVGARGCRTFGETIAVGPCLAVEGGGISATGAGAAVQEPRTERRLWLAASGGGLLTVRGGRLALRLQVDAVVPVFRERFYIEGAQVVNRPAALGGRLFSGVEVRFP